VFHLDPPKSLEAYYQETGRAGRDGLPATAMMTWGLADVALLRRLIDDGGNPDRARVEHRKLDALLGYCETTRCRRQVLLQHFGDDHPGGCANCDTCLEPVETWDGTEAAQKLLSAVVRTGSRFGQAYLIDVLLGEANERMQRFGHDRIPTFGAGKELDRNAWRSVVRQLVAAGLLVVEVDGYGGLRPAGAARDVLRGERSVPLRRDTVAPVRSRRERRKPPTVATTSDADPRLFEKLRAKRTELARAQSVPPYVVFSDRSLLEMAAARPADLAAMRAVHGVGDTKLARYGDAFLAVIREHAAEAPIG
jgi:ATP-dependent DNA helicase RecQ